MDAVPRFDLAPATRARPALHVVEAPVVEAPRHLSLRSLIADVGARALADGEGGEPRVVARFEGAEHLELRVAFDGPAPTTARALITDAMQVLLGRRVISCSATRGAADRVVTYALHLDPPAEAS